MIVVDTSAWIKLLRNHESPVRRTLHQLLEQEADLAVTEVVVAELLAGATSESHRDALRSRLLAFPVLSLRGLRGFEQAADLHRTARSRGVTVRRLADCLVAAPCIAAQATLLHADRDFDELSRVSDLRIHPVGA